MVRDEDHDFDEHCIVERDDGSLFAIIRVWKGLLQSTSVDGGKTWSDPAHYIEGARSRAHLRRLASGRLLLIYHDGPPRPGKDKPVYGREMLTAFLSDDGGRTWPWKLMLDARNSVSYPDATEAPDGRIFITYDYARYVTGCKEVLFTSLTEALILAGGTAPPPILVNRATGFGNTVESKKADEEATREKANKQLLEGKTAK
jgi:hypothetical protein